MLPSLIRTYTPLLVAYLVGWLASLGITVDDDTQALITTGIGTVIAAAYYALVRVLERKWPALSVLLGSGQQPAAYSPDGQTRAAPAVTVTTATTAADPTPPDDYTH